jgi:hypothetical protein
MADGDLILDHVVNDMPWRLDVIQGPRMLNSGFSQVTRMAEPRWMFELSTGWMARDSAEFREWDYWLHDRDGAASTFTAFRMSMQNAQVPVSSDVGLTVTAIDRAARTVSFGSTGTWTATKGDMVSFYTAAGGYWIGQAMETKSAVAGAMSALKVRPPPFTPHASLAAPRRIRALGEFQLVLPVPKPIERIDECRINFTASQIIRG